MNATSRDYSGCIGALPFVFALAASACAADPNEGRVMMTAQELATAGNIATCDTSEDYEVHCHGRVITDRTTGCPHQNPGPAGFSPSQLRSAYKISGTGSSATTIAVIEDYGYANAEADLQV